MAAKTFKEWQEIKKYNPYHGSDGKFTTGASAVSFSINRSRKGGRTAIANEKKRTSKDWGDEYGSGDASAAVAEQRSGKGNSLSGFMNPDGSMKNVRKQLHSEIIHNILKGKTPPSGKPILRIMGGGPASGKSSALSSGAVNGLDPTHSIIVDPDAIKEMLPGYKGMAKVSNEAAGYFHEESSLLAKQLHAAATKRGLNVTYDGTGDGAPKSLQSKIDIGRNNGYEIEGVYVTIDTKKALQRNMKRYQDALAEGRTARLPNPKYVQKTHAEVTKRATEMASQFDRITVIDNNGPKGSAHAIATGGNGKGLTPLKGREGEFKKFLDKANDDQID